ncbi:MAG: M4 family metallopeptidase [Bacteroidetes bacterium]|nr:M4 family metallopeptidase [Bacteroidota bacterium]
MYDKQWYNGGRCGSSLSDSWCPLDIIAHEYTHAVTFASADLNYSYESGLNESFSDIFGEVIENYVTGNDWLVGADRASGAFRSLANPNTYGHPDTYLSTNSLGPWYTGSDDFGGVHTNSGVQNFWFYLLVNGGSGTNDNNDVYNVQGIGMSAAAKVAYSNLTSYLWSSSDYADARWGSIQAAIDISFGNECSPLVQSVTNAWYAVGVGGPFINISAAGSTTFCPGDNVQLSTAVAMGSTYQWKKNNVNIPGATNSSYIATASGSYKVVVTRTCGSVTSNSITVTVNPSPSATITAQSSTTICNGENVVLSANGGTGFTYQWQKGTTNIGGANSKTYLVSTGGTYKVIVTNASGCSSLSSGTAVIVKSVPTSVITPSGATYFCAGDTLVLNANSGTGLTYQWKKGSTIIGGATSKTYLASSGGTYKVIVTNASGCTSLSAGTTVTVKSIPSALITPSGPTNFCTGGSSVLNANMGTGLTYQWKKGNSNIGGATLSSYTATVTNNYSVIVTNSNGCSKTSNSVLVTGPPSAAITITGSQTICPPGTVTFSAPTGNGLTYQWLKDNLNLPGAIASSYVATSAGNYKVTVTNSFGCSTTSGPKTVTVSCRSYIAADIESNEFLSIYPNPNAGTFILEMYSETNQDNSIIEICNTLGNRFIDQKLT